MIAQFLYFLVAVVYTLLAVLFYKSRNGKLRKLLIFFFSCCASGALVRLTAIHFPEWFDPAYVNLFVILPIALSGIFLIIFLHKTYISK